MSTDAADLAAAFSGRTITDPADMAPFLTDWRGAYHGLARAIVQPDTPEDVARVVRWCAARRAPVVPQGGNTGLSGGATPDASGNAVLLSLARLTRIRDVDPVENIIAVDAGVTLADVRAAAAEVDRLFPLGLASEGSCTIGGNLATNAGGVATLRYGNARALCLGLEVVTAAGELWNGMRRLRKDNSGYDLRDLFIGSEGTLGVITGAVLALHPRPVHREVAFASIASPADALRLLDVARAVLDTALTAFELIGEPALILVERHVPGARRPLPPAAWALLIEASGARPVREPLEALLSHEAVLDAVIADSLAQADALWRQRESIPEAQAKEGRGIKHDIALPLSRIPAFLDDAASALDDAAPGARRVTFGHLGDGNLHYNLSAPEGADPEAFAAGCAAINRVVHDLVRAHGGSISAEHGLGQLRRDEAAAHRSPVEADLMRRVKAVLDPHGIMNPGKVLSSSL